MGLELNQCQLKKRKKRALKQQQKQKVKIIIVLAISRIDYFFKYKYTLFFDFPTSKDIENIEEEREFHILNANRAIL